jgi:phage terminase large subunit GpA-like protein
MYNIDTIGSPWAAEMAGDLTDEIVQRSPVECNQEMRFLPSSETSHPGYINFDRTPYWIEPLECFDVRSDVREVDIMKSVQSAYSTVLRSIVFYFAVQIRTSPGIYANVTIEQAREIIDSAFIPMFQQSGLEHIFQSHDIGNSRKRGVTKNHIQWVGGGHMIPKGGQKAHQMRETPALFLLLDEVDAYPDNPDGDPIGLFIDRTTAFDEIRKVFIGCTPTIKGASRIEKRYLRGDQRKYMVHCLKCGGEQELRFSGTNKETGKTYGLKWDTNNGQLDIDSVRYHCKFCDNPHTEHDKVRLITKDNCEWKPTVIPVEPGIRSYHITGLMSRRSRWSKGVSMWLAAYDTKKGRTKSLKAMKQFYNNFLAKTFEEDGEKLQFRAVSSHRRSFYIKGQIPNLKIEEYSITGVLFLTMTVDVHKHHLNVSIWGWTAGDGFGFNPWLVDYYQITDDSDIGFASLDAPGWEQLADVIDNGVWKSDDGREYRTIVHLIDSGWAESVVLDFCRQWSAERCVWPIKGDKNDISDKGITNFKESKAKTGDLLYVIKVNHYKDRIAPILGRPWRTEKGIQRPYTFNAPADTTDDEIKELTKEWKREKKLANGRIAGYEWHRPHGADNELWDLLVYGHASVEILAWLICVKNYKMETVDWPQFWEYCKTGVFWQEAD